MSLHFKNVFHAKSGQNLTISAYDFAFSVYNLFISLFIKKALTVVL